jgi:hypothetical protein
MLTSTSVVAQPTISEPYVVGTNIYQFSTHGHGVLNSGMVISGRGGQRPPVEAGSLCLASAATQHLEVPLWLHGDALRGRLTTGPSWPTEADEPLASQECSATENVLPSRGCSAGTPRTFCWEGALGEPSLAGKPKCLSPAGVKRRRGKVCACLPAMEGCGFLRPFCEE